MSEQLLGKQIVVEVKDFGTFLGKRWIHKDLNLKIVEGDITAIVGGSGSGKTTLLRRILMLDTITEGDVLLFGQNIKHTSEEQENELRQRWGVLFQQGALFSSLTVLENVMYPIREFTNLSDKLIQEMALLKIKMTGLEIDAAHKLPSELSGGMLKRAAMARAIALDPDILFLDEPTTGLDPVSAGAIDNLVLHLRDTLGLTVVLITHDVESLRSVTDRVAFLGEGKVLANLPIDELERFSHPEVQVYFSSVIRQRPNKRER